MLESGLTRVSWEQRGKGLTLPGSHQQGFTDEVTLIALVLGGRKDMACLTLKFKAAYIEGMLGGEGRDAMPTHNT